LLRTHSWTDLHKLKSIFNAEHQVDEYLNILGIYIVEDYFGTTGGGWW